FGCWEPDFEADNGDHRSINQYDHFLATVRNALVDADIDDDGTPDQLIPKGILWMQGESDATREESAAVYEANLKRLMDLIRAAFRSDDLPVVIGRISDSGRSPVGKVWLYGDTVRDAQQAFVTKDSAAAIVTSTDDYDYSDRWHYDSADYVDLGNRFAEAMLGLQPTEN
ncbi:MAG: sialate O-acetylesterase, partial [Planctomycetota bacterium]